jgi:FkbM family methyltransferase
MKRFLAQLINRPLSVIGARIVSVREGVDHGEPAQPSASALRLRLFRQIARKGLRPAHIIDVGAHQAGWSRDAHQVFPDSAYTLIEPQAEMEPYLYGFCSEVKNARWILAGAGAANGELALTVAHDDDSSSFAIPEATARERGLERRIVPIVTLDAVCEGSTLPPPTIVKIDAEGLDVDVMLGAQTLIGVTELFFLELPLFDSWPNQSFHSIIAFMRERGYEPYDFTDLNHRPSDGALGLIEVAFAKRAGILRDHHGW